VEKTENRRDASLPRVPPFTKDFSFHRAKAQSANDSR